MQTVPLGTSFLNVSRLCYGCWRIAGWSPNEVTPSLQESARRRGNQAREIGHYRLEGRDYVVRDGDVVLFRFSV